LFEATSCDRYFSDYASKGAKVLKITISMLNSFFTFGFRAKNSIARVKEVIPDESGNVPKFDLGPIFQGETRVTMLNLHLIYL
jgi:hypothetical protein